MPQHLVMKAEMVIGVYAKGDSEVRVLGDINAEVGVNLIGDPYDYTQVTVFGEINLAEGTYEDNYVIVGSNYMPKSWGALKRTSELIDDEFSSIPMALEIQWCL